MALIRRRHVIYVEGYDPQGAEGYYTLFQKSWSRFLKSWPLKATVSPLSIDSEHFAHWEIDAAAPNWTVHTRYDFLRQEHYIRANMAEPLPRIVRRSLWWTLDYCFSGAMLRILRASWRYYLALAYFQMTMVAWVLLAVLCAFIVWFIGASLLGLNTYFSALAGIIVALAAFKLSRPIADRLFIVQINTHWPYLSEFARGQPTGFDPLIEAGAERLVEAARANAAEEVLLIGHSGGGVMAPAVLARALEMDPDLGRHGPRVIMMTLGSIMPGVALHPRATRMRAIIARAAVEPSVLWIDAQSTKDVLNFENFDPVAGIGVEVGEKRCNPLVWQVRFRDMLSEKFYMTIRANYFRLHYQFIMANDMRAPYDYFMLVSGPLSPKDWATRKHAALSEFGPDASYIGAANE